jgi:hypothetical protein
LDRINIFDICLKWEQLGNSIFFVFSRKRLMEIHELKALIKESIREVLREERMLLCQVLIPYVSDEEQAELNEIFGSPSDYEEEESVEMTEWVRLKHPKYPMIF